MVRVIGIFKPNLGYSIFSIGFSVTIFSSKRYSKKPFKLEINLPRLEGLIFFDSLYKKSRIFSVLIFSGVKLILLFFKNPINFLKSDK